MERELEKTLLEIENLIKVHGQRENTHTQSVLQIAREIIEPCAKAARTLPDLKEILERDTAKKVELINGGVPVCPECGAKVLKHYTFCKDCGQKLEQ